jgi:flagellar FliL protein
VRRDGAPAAMYSIENIVLNPAGTSGSRYLLLSVALVLSDPAAEAGARAREIEVRDRIVALLATQTVDRLIDPAQRDSIKDEIRSSVEPIFPKGVVRGVLLPQFVVQ